MLDISNYYEQLVSDRLGQLLHNSERPPTQAFLEDVACIALNHLPPRYIRHRVDMGSHLTERDYEEMDRQVDEAVMVAIAQASNRPHDSRD